MWNWFRTLLQLLVERCVVLATTAVCRRKLPLHMRSFCGVENLPLDRGFILVANHQSYFDSIMLYGVLAMVLGRRPLIPTKVKAFRGFWRSVWHRALGGVPIDPADPRTAYDDIRALLQRGEIILMFPEGERSLDQKLLPFRYGAFNLAVESGAPIIPVGIRNASGVLPKGSVRFVKGATASLVIDRPIWPHPTSASETNAETARRLCAHAERTIGQLVTGAPAAPQLALRDQAAIARAVEARVEKLLDDGLESIRPAQARELIDSCRMLRHWCKDYRPLEVQSIRVSGFWILSVWKPIAALFLFGYRKSLQRLLTSDPQHPYLNYFAAQFHARVPRFFGADRVRAMDAFGRAYSNAADYGLDPARFVVSYADALAAHGQAERALALLGAHYPNVPRQETPRLWRRRLRSESLMLELTRRLAGT